MYRMRHGYHKIYSLLHGRDFCVNSRQGIWMYLQRRPRHSQELDFFGERIFRCGNERESMPRNTTVTGDEVYLRDTR